MFYITSLLCLLHLFFFGVRSGSINERSGGSTWPGSSTGAQTQNITPKKRTHGSTRRSRRRRKHGCGLAISTTGDREREEGQGRWKGSPQLVSNHTPAPDGAVGELDGTEGKANGRDINIINLSSYTLTDDECKLLSRGLNFVPSMHCDLFKASLDLNKFVRLITLRRHFADKQDDGSFLEDCGMSSDQSTPEPNGDISPDTERMPLSCPLDFQDECAVLTLKDLHKEGFWGDVENVTVTHTDLRSKSVYYPIQSKNYYINLFQKLVQQDIDGLAEKWGRTQGKMRSGLEFANLTAGETRALKSLSNNKQIVIKAADKGGSVVVLDAAKYEGEIKRQLMDTDTYIPLEKDPTVYFQKLLGDLLSEGLSMGILNNKEHDYLHCINPIIPIFHILPKVHKSLEDVKGRPIVAGIGSLNEGLSCYVDKLLMPLVLQLPTYLRDTTMCINKLADLEWKPTYRWFSMDVAALYSSIDHTLGLNSIQYWLQQEGCFPAIQMDFILQAVHF
uniref:Uncharacterized protein n=1 Tax=Xenopus tropicalis TaxID=8364 RepID=A0A803JMR8_XENTR